MTVDELLEAMRSIMDAAEQRDEGDLTDEEVERYETLEGQLNATRKRDEVKKRHAAYNATSPGPVITGHESKNDDTLERAFTHYLRTGKENQDIAELRAQSVGTDSAGGFTVPEVFRQKLVDRLLSFGGLASEVETISTSGGEDMRWPTLDDTANTGEIAAEGAGGAGGADLVFSEKTLGAFKYVAPGTAASPLRVSVELLQDSAFDIESLVTRKLGERIARVQAEHWVTGTGSGEPEGIIQSSGTSNTFAGASPTKDELIDALHSVDPDYRAGAIWVFNDATLAEIRKLEDANGRPLLQGVTEGIGSQIGGFSLLGHRVAIDQAFADYTDASSNVWGVFGDVREGYVIRRVRDLQVIVNPFARANEGQVEYTLWARADGAIQNEHSFSLLANDAV